jgi:hypothetical protein
VKIGYYVQGDADEAVVCGLARRWCPDAARAPGRFRGSSRESFKRELDKSLRDLVSHQACDVVVVLTDADEHPWRDVRRREAARISGSYRHVTVFGVADRNIEWWLATDRIALARELDCGVEDIPADEPHLSRFVKRRFGLTGRDSREDAKERIGRYVLQGSLRPWIRDSDSFKAFYDEARSWAARSGCSLPNELEA